MKYAHIVQAVFGAPWAIRPEVLAVIVDLVRFEAGGGKLSAEEVRERIGAAPQRRDVQAQGGVGVLPYLDGVIMKRAGLMAQTSGATSLDSWMQTFRSAMADPEVSTIIMPIDSPGGSVEGLPEAAAEIRAARDQKRIVAIADGMAASAAYWLGSQASEFVVAPSGSAGSIGVYTAHQDLSAAYEEAGIKTTLISAGKYKTEGNEFAALTSDAQAYAQSVVDDYYGMFVADVAKGRGVAVADVRSGYGEGRNLLAKPAKAAGLIDRIDTIDGVVRRELSMRPAKSRQVALGPGWETLAGNMESIEVPEGEEGVLIVDDPALPEAPPLETEPVSSLAFELELRRRRAASR